MWRQLTQEAVQGVRVHGERSILVQNDDYVVAGVAAGVAER